MTGAEFVLVVGLPWLILSALAAMSLGVGLDSRDRDRAAEVDAALTDWDAEAEWDAALARMVEEDA